MSNSLVAVQTFNPAMLASFSNMCPWYAECNKKYDDFAKQIPKNLGDTVLIKLPTRMSAQDGLVVGNVIPVVQRPLPLVINGAAYSAYNFSNQERIFNMNQKEYMEELGNNAVEELGYKAGSYFSTVAVKTGYRYYGDGKTPITSYGQLARMLANFRNFGVPKGKIKIFFDDLTIPGIIDSGLNQFAPRRNDEIANSWDIGTFNGAEFFATNIITTFTAGVVNNEGAVLTITSISSDGTTITASGAPTSQSGAVVSGDRFTIDPTNQFGLRFLTFGGHITSGQYVQVRATQTVASDGGGNVTFTVVPALIYDATQVDPARNLNINLSALSGVQMTGPGNHKAAYINAGDSFFGAMPPLENEDPYNTSVTFDPETQCSMRTYYGSIFRQNTRGITHDAIYDFTAPDENGMTIIIPI